MEKTSLKNLRGLKMIRIKDEGIKRRKDQISYLPVIWFDVLEAQKIDIFKARLDKYMHSDKLFIKPKKVTEV